MLQKFCMFIYKMIFYGNLKMYIKYSIKYLVKCDVY